MLQKIMLWIFCFGISLACFGASHAPRVINLLGRTLAADENLGKKLAFVFVQSKCIRAEDFRKEFILSPVDSAIDPVTHIVGGDFSVRLSFSRLSKSHTIFVAPWYSVYLSFDRIAAWENHYKDTPFELVLCYDAHAEDYVLRHRAYSSDAYRVVVQAFEDAGYPLDPVKKYFFVTIEDRTVAIEL